MTLATAILIICGFVFIGAYSVEKGLRKVIEKRFDEQEKALDKLKDEMENLRETLEDVRHNINDNVGEG